MIPGFAHRRRFRHLSEQEVLALAISSDEDDARITPAASAQVVTHPGHEAVTIGDRTGRDSAG